MTVLVDTPIIIDHLRDDPRAVQLLKRLFEEEGRIWAATPTRTEVLAGIRRHERRPMLQLFDVLSWVEIDAIVADAAGELARRFRRSHGRIDTTDFLIAAAAQYIDARLITLNVRHYPMFPMLRPAYSPGD